MLRLEAELEDLRRQLGAFEALKASHAELQQAFLELGRSFQPTEDPGAAYLAELRALAREAHQ